MSTFLIYLLFSGIYCAAKASMQRRVHSNLRVEDFAEERIIPVKQIRALVPPDPIRRGDVGSKLKCYDAISREEEKLNIEAEIIANLDDYIDPLGKLGCFILVNNFQGINIPELNHPIVLRYPQLVALPTRDSNGIFDVELFWVSNNLYPQNGSGSTGKIFKRHCKISKFLATFWESGYAFSNLHDYCLRIIQHRFAFSSLPWNCEAQFGLFPIMKIYQPSCRVFQYYPRTWKYEGPTLSSEHMLSLSVPTVNVIITHKLGLRGLAPFQGLMVATFIRYYFDGLGGNYVSQAVFLYGIVSSKTRDEGTTESGFSLGFLKLVRISFENALRQDHNPTPLLIKFAPEQFNPDNLSLSLQHTSSPSAENMLVWNVKGLPCNSPVALKPLSGAPEQLVYERQSRAWFSIFGNYTFKNQNGTSCVNGGVQKHPPPYESPIIWHVYLGWHIDYQMLHPYRPMAHKYLNIFRSLRFISCASLRQEPLLFKELINIYQLWVWAWLVIAMIVLASIISYAGRNGSFIRNILAVYKVVVGQGDPFMYKIFSRVPLRFAIVAFLFMGIILHEGYKNSNMYNIISPRRIISKENFSELVSDKFTVYTRTSELDFELLSMENPEIARLKYSKHSITAGGIARAHSEVHTMVAERSLQESSSLHPMLPSVMMDLVLGHKHWYNFVSFKNFFRKEARKGNVTLDPEKIFQKMADNSASLDDFTTNQMLRLQEIAKIWNQGSDERKASGNVRSAELSNIVQNWEQETLFSFLQDCSSAALILPESLAVEYAKRLRITENQHLSIGMESYPPKTTGIFLSGLIPPVIFRRVRWMGTSGIWDWHLTVVRKWRIVSAMRTFGKPVQATMSGNVSVIFLILPVGFVLASVQFFAEMLLYHARRILNKGSSKSNVDHAPPKISLAILIMLKDVANLVFLQTNMASRNIIRYSEEEETL